MVRVQTVPGGAVAGDGALSGVPLSGAPPARRRLDTEFTDFYLDNYRPLTAYCVSLVGWDDGEELAQEALVRLFARWRRVQAPRAYVYLVALNLARGRWRRQKVADSALRQLIDATPTAAEPPLVEVRDMVARLPRRLREPVVLYYLADLPLAEVARVLRRPAGSVKAQLHEARGLLARAWEERS